MELDEHSEFDGLNAAMHKNIRMLLFSLNAIQYFSLLFLFCLVSPRDQLEAWYQNVGIIEGIQRMPRMLPAYKDNAPRSECCGDVMEPKGFLTLGSSCTIWRPTTTTSIFDMQCYLAFEN